MSVRVDADALLRLAGDPNLSHSVRASLLTMERAGTDGVARWESGELAELLLDLAPEGKANPSKGHHAWAQGIVRTAMRHACLGEGSTVSQTRLPGGVSVTPDTLYAVQPLDNGRVLAECGSGHRAVYAADRVGSGTARCASCR